MTLLKQKCLSLSGDSWLGGFKKSLIKKPTKSTLAAFSGRSMIEMLGVLAIIGVLTVGGIAGYSKAMEHLRNNKIANNISQLATNILTLYAQQKDFKGLYHSTVGEAGAIPDGLRLDSWGRIFDSFNNRYDLDYDSDGFTISFHTRSKETCLALVTLNWENYSPNFVGVLLTAGYRNYGFSYCSEGWTKDYESWRRRDYIACRGYLPISPAIAKRICNNIGTYIDYKHSMILKFSK